MASWERRYVDIMHVAIKKKKEETESFWTAEDTFVPKAAFLKRKKREAIGGYLVAQCSGVEFRSPPSWSTIAPFDM